MSFKVITFFHFAGPAEIPCSPFAHARWSMRGKLVLRQIAPETWRYIQMKCVHLCILKKEKGGGRRRRRIYAAAGKSEAEKESSSTPSSPKGYVFISPKHDVWTNRNFNLLLCGKICISLDVETLQGDIKQKEENKEYEEFAFFFLHVFFFFFTKKLPRNQLRTFILKVCQLTSDACC